MHLIRRLLFLAACFVLGLFIAAVTDPPKGRPYPMRDLLAMAHPKLADSGEGLWTLGCLMVDYPIPFLVVTAVFLVPWLIAIIVSLIPRHISKDPQRLFTKDQRRAGALRSGDRCEMEGIFFTRCRSAGGHGDHWFPHSLGGSTTLANFVWACPPCNMSKSARVPTFWETTRLEWRRRRYFDPSEVARPTRRAGVH